MFRSICKKLVSLPLKTESLTSLSNTHLQLVHVNALIITIKPFSSSISYDDDYGVDNPFVVFYLINSCGLPREKAIRIASRGGRKLNVKNSEGPDKVLALFKTLGFSDTMITKIVSNQPLLLSYRNPVENFLPKVEFLHSIGIPRPEVLKFLVANPPFFSLNLERKIIPTYEFLKSVLVSNERVVYSLKRCGWIFSCNHTNTLQPNIEFLRNIGVSSSNVSLLLTNFPGTLLLKRLTLHKYVDEVRGLGFDVSKSMFVVGLYALSGKSTKSIVDRCMKVYKGKGWTDDDISSAFRKYPQCMLFSEKKITKTIDFLVNKMGCTIQELVEFPIALGSSLERRIIPRCSVVHVLLSKGLVRNWRLSSVVLPIEKDFLRKFVDKFSEEAPELLSVYEGKLNVFKE